MLDSGSMSTPRRIVAGLCLPLLLAAGVLCLCPHGEAADAADATRSGCASHAEQPLAPLTGDHAPACPHCGGEELLAASLPDATSSTALLGLGAAPAAPALRLAPAFAALSFAAPPPPLTGRARLAHHRVLRV